MKKNFTEIEEIIETRIAQLSEEYDLDRYDIEGHQAGSLPGKRMELRPLPP